MSLSDEADALVAKVGSSHHGTPSSAVLSNAGAKVNDLEKSSGSGEPETKKYLASPESAKSPESEADGNEPGAKDGKSKDVNIPGEGDKSEDKHVDNVDKEGEKKHKDKGPDADTKDGEENPTEASNEDKKKKDSKDKDKEDKSKGGDTKAKDSKGGDTDSKDKAHTTDSKESDDKDQKKDKNDKKVDIPPPPSPKSLASNPVVSIVLPRHN